MVHGTESVPYCYVGTGLDSIADVFLGFYNGFFYGKTSCQESGDGRGKGATGSMNVSGSNGFGGE